MDATNVETVAIVLYEGFDELDAIGPYEVFETAASYGADLAVDLCTLEPADSVTASHGLEVLPQAILDEDYDLLVVPGGGWNDRGEQGAWAQVQRGSLPDAVREHHASGTVVASVCTGGMIVAASGVAEGRPATTHHGAIDDLRESGAEVVDARVVDDGDLLTAGGVTSGLDLALWIVERSNGATIADRTAREMEYERTGDVHSA